MMGYKHCDRRFYGYTCILVIQKRPAGPVRMWGHGDAGRAYEVTRRCAVSRQNSPAAGHFARLWAQLPPARQRSMIREVQAALREVTDRKVANAGAINTVHEPMTGSHSHAHHAYKSQGGDQSHQHLHTHDNDANHDHSHEPLDAAAASAERARQAGHQQMRLMNSAREPGDDPWERLAAMTEPID